MSNASTRPFQRLAALLAVLLLLALAAAPPIEAADASVIDPSATGALTLQLKCGDAPLAGGVFSVYRVAQLDPGPQLFYHLLAPFDGAGVDLNAAKTAAQLQAAAAALASVTGSATPTATGLTTGADGKTSLKGLALGAYLVVQTGGPANYSLAAPFLVFLPMTDSTGTSWVYEMTATPKVNYNPPASKDTGTQNTATVVVTQKAAPQTGLVQWPVPVLALTGALLLLLGLRRGRRHGDGR